MKDLSAVKPGDFVRLIGLPESRLQVVEVITQTCPGGTQYAVACRCFDESREFSTNLQRFNVIEVEAIPPDEAQPTLVDLLRAAKEVAVAQRRFDVADLLRKAQSRAAMPLEEGMEPVEDTLPG